MRAFVFVGVVVGVTLASQAGTQRGDPDNAERIARLVKQLGNDAFVTREAASSELEAIGSPALAALRKAVASSDDPEIRWRAKQISARVAEAAAMAELVKLQGVWTVASYEIERKQLPGMDKRSTMTISGETWVARWAKENGVVQVESGVLKVLYQEQAPPAVDFVHVDGPHKGSTVFAISRVDGGRFTFCYRVRAEDRPTEFATKAGDPGCGLVTFNQEKK